MKPLLTLITLILLTASPAFAQTRMAFTAVTDPSGFVTAQSKACAKVAKDLAKDFTKHAKKDSVVVVQQNAEVTITVLSRVMRPGGLVGMYVKNFAGEKTQVELRAGSYATTLEGRNTQAVAHVIRQWLKDNQQALEGKKIERVVGS